nr:PREDICTED: retinoic acid receptor responder protein 3-like isoform X1 [Rhinolophus sinicus]
MASFFEEPEPGDMIEIFHIGYKDWAIYMGDGYVIHLAPSNRFPRIGSSKMFMFLSGEAVVTKEPLKTAAWGCLRRVNNCLDHEFRPQSVNQIISSAEKMVGDTKTYKVIFDNSERFATTLRYGWPRCKMSGSDPIPGDMIEIHRPVYKHWVIYVGDGHVVHVSYAGSGYFGGNTFIMVKVKCERLQDVAGNDGYSVNNYLDNKYRPRPTDKIVNLARKEIDKTWKYNVFTSNCEHFATKMRYGRSQSKQSKKAMTFVGVTTMALPLALVI